MGTLSYLPYSHELPPVEQPMSSPIPNDCILSLAALRSDQIEAEIEKTTGQPRFAAEHRGQVPLETATIDPKIQQKYLKTAAEIGKQNSRTQIDGNLFRPVKFMVKMEHKGGDLGENAAVYDISAGNITKTEPNRFKRACRYMGNLASRAAAGPKRGDFEELRRTRQRYKYSPLWPSEF
jgi:hypothetical protein